jgi:hypothetical protein
LDLKGLLAPFPSVRLAGPEDGPRILELYDRTALSGRSLRLRSVRSPDFFRLLRYQGERHTVLVDEDESGALRGVAAFTHRPGYVGGTRREVTYLGDFRMAFDRRALRVWRDLYGAWLKASGDPTITCVIDENTAAQNSLVRQKKASFRYELLAPYRMVNVLGRAPWGFARRAPRLGDLRARRAKLSDLPRLREFLDRQARGRAFGYCFAGGELERRLSVWDGLSIESFFLLERQGEVLGCFALWSPAGAKSNVIEKLPWHFGLYRPFVRFPRQGEALRAMYLTHLEIDRELPASDRAKLFALLFESMAEEAWDPSWHLVSFCDFPSASLAQGLKGHWLLQSVPMKLFTVRHADVPALVLDSRSMEEPGFEIALV